jgi:hypothetical protein
MKKHIKIIAVQFLFLILIGIIIYMLYPKTNAVVNGNFVKFNSINANVIVISENPDFSNPRYIEMQGRNNISFDLKPGKYYWKSDNGIIEGLKNEFIIDSEVGLGINRTENESNLVNIGNVKINITKTKNGMMVGHIILDVEESEKIEDNGNYIGRQEE